jgi:hydrogenase maturation protein HypF
MPIAYSIKVTGVVQGVGFRPFIYRVAQSNGLKGWVLNAENGLEIHLEGEQPALQSFLAEMKAGSPQAATVVEVSIKPTPVSGFPDFTIRESIVKHQPTVRVSPDLRVCDHCLEDLFDPQDPRYHYPYVNCTNCGPRYTVVGTFP